MLLTHIAFYRVEVRQAQRELQRTRGKRCPCRNEIASRALISYDSAPFSPISFPPFVVITSRHLIVSAVSLLALSALFGILNLQKTGRWRAAVTRTEAARQSAEQLRIAREKELKEREAAVVAANAKFGDTQTKMASTKEELLKTQTERNDLGAKLRQNEIEIAELRKQVENAKTSDSASASTASTAELQAQLEDAKKQLDAAEREKLLLLDKMKISQERSTQPETQIKHRTASGGNPGIRSTVLAVNQAYNFVVLSLGGRQGVESNSEMLVLRGGSFIGKIRISSVEPATAIGDIITSTLARGVQVQTGDTVLYAGNNF